MKKSRNLFRKALKTITTKLGKIRLAKGKSEKLLKQGIKTVDGKGKAAGIEIKFKF